MGLFDRFRKKPGAGTWAPPSVNETSVPSTGHKVEVEGRGFTITVSSPGFGREVAGLPRDTPTMPEGGFVNVVGESYYEDAFLRLTGGRCSEGYRAACTARIVPEPDNQYDPLAVAVHIGGVKVGHLSRDDARAYRPYLDEIIGLHGQATAAATLTGGWDRGHGDIGSFGVELRFSDRPDHPPEPGGNDIRLRGGGTVSVSNEEHYQEALRLATQGRDLSVRKYPVAVELRTVDSNPHVKKATGPVLEVLLGDAVVGYLTRAMSERFGRLARRSIDEGRPLTATGSVGLGTKGGAEIAEITLSGVPMALDETVVPDEGIELIEDLVQHRRTGTLHRLRDSLQDGSRRTECGVTVSSGDVVRVLSSKPWVGLVNPDTRQLVSDAALDRCQKCGY